MDGLVSLTLETTCIFPVFLVGLLLWSSKGRARSPYGWGMVGLVMLSGVVTAVPLLLYGTAVKWIPFSTVGFFFSISRPPLVCFLGIVLYQEAFTTEDFMVFIFYLDGLVALFEHQFISGVE